VHDVTVNAKGEMIRVTWREAAAFFRGAGDILRRYGYSPFPEYEGSEGYSLGMALCLSTSCADGPAQAMGQTDHTAVCDEVRRRFVGYLYLTGNLIMGHHGSSLASEIEWWERDPSAPGPEGSMYVPRDQVVAMLASLAAILMEGIDMYAKVMIRQPRNPAPPIA
jgi:hypothetical protein